MRIESKLHQFIPAASAAIRTQGDAPTAADSGIGTMLRNSHTLAINT
jgi:hypothetical protein